MSEIKDSSLAEQGKNNLTLAESQMPGLMKIRERFEKEKPLEGQRIGLALHVTKETGVLVRTLIAGGASVAIASCNPLSTQDDVAAALAEEGIEVYAKKGETNEEYYDYINKVLDTKPTITIDDGMDLVIIIHTKGRICWKTLLAARKKQPLESSGSKPCTRRANSRCQSSTSMTRTQSIFWTITTAQASQRWTESSARPTC